MRYTNEETIHLDVSYNAIIQKTLLHKEKDHGRVTFTITKGNINVGKSLIDLGSSINMIPLLVVKQVGDLDVKQLKMKLQLVDKSIMRLSGIAEEVLVRVNKFIFPIYFMVMDIEVDDKVPLILGRPS